MNQVGHSERAEITLCYGTRPQVIKASVLRRALGRRWRVQAVDTGQHYDYALNRLLYEQLQVRPPDVFLEVGSGTHAEQTASILTRAEALLKDSGPRVVVVIGDTNSTLGAALAAVKLRIPVVHVEAGLRARDDLMAEEINRRVVDAVSTVLCAPSQSAAEQLRRERPGSQVFVTGDVARDVLLASEPRLPATGAVLPPGITGRYLLATLHRAELTEHLTLLRQVLRALGELPIPTVLPMHPRTKAALKSDSLGGEFGALRVVGPVGYLESVALIRGAAGVLTDSGGVQREAYWLGVPCVTLRRETEWGETVLLGANRLLEPGRVPLELPGVVHSLLEGVPGVWNRDAYGNGDAADRVADAVTALTGRP